MLITIQLQDDEADRYRALAEKLGMGLSELIESVLGLTTDLAAYEEALSGLYNGQTQDEVDAWQASEAYKQYTADNKRAWGFANALLGELANLPDDEK